MRLVSHPAAANKSAYFCFSSTEPKTHSAPLSDIITVNMGVGQRSPKVELLPLITLCVSEDQERLLFMHFTTHGTVFTLLLICFVRLRLALQFPVCQLLLPVNGGETSRHALFGMHK